jgi:hypothetical protein
MSRNQPRVITPPEFEDVQSPDFRYVYVTGVFGGLDPNDGKMIFYLDRLIPETTNRPHIGALEMRKILRELQVEIHMSPTQFKNIYLWMQKHITRYEDTFGEIPLGPRQQPPTDSTLVT